MREGNGGDLQVRGPDANTIVAKPFELICGRIIKRQHAPPVEEIGQPPKTLVIRDLTAHRARPGTSSSRWYGVTIRRR